jgi:hypothetical protein
VNDEEAQYLLQVRLNWQEEDPRWVWKQYIRGGDRRAVRD